ncbi:MAG: ATPase [Bacteroidia bacterium]|nr:ATPase [Bacteroidia bacterium]
MKLIVESGATKADWCLLDTGAAVKRFKTPGMNFSTMSEEAVREIVASAVPLLAPSSVSEVFLYAAGLIEGSPAQACAADAFSTAFPDAGVECASDMLAAARAACGRSEGIAAILGTGSNSCFYDGERILRNVRSGGFILGDEGGGACLGKLFLSDYIKGIVPEPLSSEFGAAFEVDYMTVVDRVYRQPAPSAYLGSFAPWILEHCGTDDYARNLLLRNLSDFFDRSILRHGRTDVPVGFVGGFAAACEPYLHETAVAKGMSISKIVASPMDELIHYHSL